MKNMLFILLLCLFAQQTVAQKTDSFTSDYIVLLSGDTLRGAVKRASNANKMQVTLQNGNVKTVYSFEQITSYTQKGHRTIIRHYLDTRTDKPSFSEFSVLAESKHILYLRDDWYDFGVYYIQFDNSQPIQTTKSNMANVILPRLMKCAVFAAQYKSDFDKMTTWGADMKAMRTMIEAYRGCE